MYYQKENFNGTYDFRSRSHKGFIMNSHLHEYSEILYCKGGSCPIAINGNLLTLHANEFVFIPPNFIHQYMCTDANVVCAVFSNDFIPLFFKHTKGKKIIVKPLKADELSSIFEMFPDISNKPVLITAYLNLVCNKVLENLSFEKTCETNEILYQKVISYISENFREDISLKHIAAKFGYNKKYLSSALHSLTGIHFSDFIAMYRIELAKELITKNSELSITEIATHCGFTAMNTFNRQFKKMTLMTPTQFKKAYSIHEF